MAKNADEVENTGRSRDETVYYSYSDVISRNLGIMNEVEQEILLRSTIAIAGVGGVGGLLAERLIRIGVGNLKITDPGTFEPSNFNRQFGSSSITLAKNKAEVIYNQLKHINPSAQILYDTTGISSQSDADRFTAGCDVVIDEMDFGLFKHSIWLQRAARKRGKYYFFTSALGFGALLVIFDPAGLTLEEYDDLPTNLDLSSMEQPRVSLERVMPVMPSYAPVASRQVLKGIYAGQKTAPTVSVGVGLASILAANEAINIILERRDIPTAPKYTYIDLMDRQFVLGSVQQTAS